MADVEELKKRRTESPAGAGHYHITDRYPFQLRALIDGVEVARSTQVMILKEVGTSVYNPAFYFPADDVDLSKFEREDDFSTECPIKGSASYWRYTGPESIERVAWSYDAPLPYSEMIASHLGFDQRRVTLEISPSAS